MLKKVLKKSYIIASIITIIGLLVNLVCAHFFDFLLFTIKTNGGEYISYRGFGILLENIVPLTNDNSSVNVITNLSFDLIGLLISFILVFIVVVIVISIINKVKNKKK